MGLRKYQKKKHQFFVTSVPDKSCPNSPINNRKSINIKNN